MPSPIFCIVPSTGEIFPCFFSSCDFTLYFVSCLWPVRELNHKAYYHQKGDYCVSCECGYIVQSWFHGIQDQQFPLKIYLLEVCSAVHAGRGLGLCRCLEYGWVHVWNAPEWSTVEHSGIFKAVFSHIPDIDAVSRLCVHGLYCKLRRMYYSLHLCKAFFLLH